MIHPLPVCLFVLPTKHRMRSCRTGVLDPVVQCTPAFLKHLSPILFNTIFLAPLLLPLGVFFCCQSNQNVSCHCDYTSEGRTSQLKSGSVVNHCEVGLVQHPGAARPHSHLLCRFNGRHRRVSRRRADLRPVRPRLL